VAALPSTFKDEFALAPLTPWVTLKSGKVAGEVRSAGGAGFSAGNVTFVAVNKAGCVIFFFSILFVCTHCVGVGIWCHMTNLKLHW
jgi:hypothetical protein